MAKREYRLNAGFDETLGKIHDAVMQKSVSASFEDGSDFSCGDVRCAVRVYERYSFFGSNRVSMNVTVFGRDGDVSVSAVTSGGSQAMFLKVNTAGEAAFLETLTGVLDRFEDENARY